MTDRTELGKGAFKYAAPCAWNQLQTVLNLKEPVSLGVFKLLLNDLEATQNGCKCFDWLLEWSLLLFIAWDNIYMKLWIFYNLVIYYLLYYVLCYMFHVVMSVTLLICAAACLGQNALGKEIFNLNEFSFWLNKGNNKTGWGVTV